MMTRYVVFMMLVAGALVIPGSGCDSAKGCQDLCAARESCPDVVPIDRSCELQCKDLELLLKAASCEEKQQAFDDCLNGLTDVCDASSCSTEASQRYACLNKYCSAVPDVAGCEPYANNP